MRAARGMAVVVLTLVAAAAWAQGNPAGPEFRVNTFTPGNEFGASVAADAAGNFVVVWQSASQDGSLTGIFGQRYAVSGMALGGEFRVNTFTTSNQFAPAVATDASGGFVVVWTSQLQDGSNFGVHAQRFSASGTPAGGEFRVNTYTTGSQFIPAVAPLPGGGFVVAWMGPDGSDYGIFAQRYAGSGAPIGPEFRVNSFTTFYQTTPRIAGDTGGFVVVWGSNNQDGSTYGIFGQRYDGAGAPAGPEFRVNSYTTGSQTEPEVAGDGAGDFVVVWQSNSQDGAAQGAFAQRYAASGAPVGGEFRVNTYTTGDQARPVVAADSFGSFVVAWETEGQDGSGRGVFGQRYDAAGAPLGGEFRVNSYVVDAQVDPAVAADPAGRFVIVWSSSGQDGSNYGVFGQRYTAIVPVELLGVGVE